MRRTDAWVREFVVEGEAGDPEEAAILLPLAVDPISGGKVPPPAKGYPVLGALAAELARELAREQGSSVAEVVDAAFARLRSP
jgi:hypothetical protein